MNAFSRILLKPVASLAGRHAQIQLNQFLAAHRRTSEVQEQVLQELVRIHANTAYGRDHRFDSIRNYEEFISAVPVNTYETLLPYMRRVFEGETTALIPPGERVLMFSRSSGTTGIPKQIPVSDRVLKHMRRGWNIFGLRILKDHPHAWLRPILQISSPTRETDSPTGLPCGAISGMLAETQKKIVRRMYVTRPEMSSIADAESRYYTLLRSGVGQEVSLITTANPSSTIALAEIGQRHCERLIRDVRDGTFTPPGEIPVSLRKPLRFRPNAQLARRMEEGIRRDGQLFPRHFWNLVFLCNWTGGTLQLYLRRLRELYGDLPIRDIGLLASEGRFSLPLEDHTSAGVAEILGNFLEFIPAEYADQPSPPTLRAHELDVGGEYVLVVTNFAGLWRYNMDDHIQVVDCFGQSPVFQFLSRGKNTANITGEKITEYQVVEAMRRVSQNLGHEVERFVLQARFAQTPYYELRLELSEKFDGDTLAAHLDAALGELNIEYRSKRNSGRLGPIRGIRLASGTLDRHEKEEIQRRGGRAEQYKHQYLLTEVLDESGEV